MGFSWRKKLKSLNEVTTREKPRVRPAAELRGWGVGREGWGGRGVVGVGGEALFGADDAA